MVRHDFEEDVRRGVLSPEYAKKTIFDFVQLVNRPPGGGSVDLSPFMHFGRTPESDEDRKRCAEVCLSALQQARGFGQFGSSVNKISIALHWPSIFQHGMLYSRSVQARLVWLLQAVVRRRSPLLFTLLRRKCLTDLVPVEMGPLGPVFKDAAFQYIYPLRVGELYLYESLVQKFVEMPALGDIVNRAFVGLFVSSGLEKGDRYRKVRAWTNNVAEDTAVYWGTTVVPRWKLNELREVLHVGGQIDIPDASTNKFGFGASAWGKLMFDVLCIPHYASPTGEFGVISTELGPQKVKCMVVNLPLFIQQQCREDRFSKLSDVSAGLVNKTPREIRDEVVKIFGGQFPLVIENAYGKYAHTKDVWPEAASGDVYAIPTSVFEKYRQSSRNLAALRGKQKGEPRTFNKRPGFNQIIQICSPKIAEAEGATFVFRVIFRAKEVYISPAHELAFEESFLRARNYTEVDGASVLRPGILLNDATGEYYYMLARYFSFRDTPLAMYPELSRWLNDFLGNMTATDFKFIWKTAKRLPSQDVNVPRAGGKIPYKEELSFSTEADVIIERYLRPGKLGDVMIMLEKIGMPRDPKVIVRRGIAIRDQLIDEGIYDLGRLPHLNYNATLGKRLHKLQEQKRLEDSRYKKDEHG